MPFPARPVEDFEIIDPLESKSNTKIDFSLLIYLQINRINQLSVNGAMIQSQELFIGAVNILEKNLIGFIDSKYKVALQTKIQKAENTINSIKDEKERERRKPEIMMQFANDKFGMIMEFLRRQGLLGDISKG